MQTPREVIRRAKENKLPLARTFINLGKAFNSILTTATYKALMNQRVVKLYIESLEGKPEI